MVTNTLEFWVYCFPDWGKWYCCRISDNWLILLAYSVGRPQSGLGHNKNETDLHTVPLLRSIKVALYPPRQRNKHFRATNDDSGQVRPLWSTLLFWLPSPPVPAAVTAFLTDWSPNRQVSGSAVWGLRRTTSAGRPRADSGQRWAGESSRQTPRTPAQASGTLWNSENEAGVLYLCCEDIS
jgi:hypothetical protein